MNPSFENHKMRGTRSSSRLCERRWMSRLVQPDFATAGQRDRCFHSPIGLFGRRAPHVFLGERPHGRGQIVAHQVEHGSQQLALGMLLDEVSVTRMDAHLGRGKRKDQPATSDVDCFQFEHVTEEGSIGFRVLAVEKEMRAVKHPASLAPDRTVASLVMVILSEVRCESNEGHCRAVRDEPTFRTKPRNLGRPKADEGVCPYI